MGWGHHGLGGSGRVYETKPITAVFCFLWFRFILSSYPYLGTPLPVADYQLGSLSLGAPKAQRPPRLGGPHGSGAPKLEGFPRFDSLES
jgi:hypothetical protein